VIFNCATKMICYRARQQTSGIPTDTGGISVFLG